MVQRNHAIGDIFLEPVAGQGVDSGFPGNNGGKIVVVKPAKQPLQLRPQYCGVGHTSKERLNAIKNNALCLDRLYRVGQTDEQAIEVVFARLGNLASFNEDVIDQQLFALDKVAKIKTQGRHIGRQFFLGFFKVHANARLAV